MSTLEKVQNVAAHFDICGDFLRAEPYGSGHINDTFLATFNQAGYQVRYIFQRINTKIFHPAEKLMDNIARVLAHAKSKLADRKDASRRAMTLILTRDEKNFYVDEEGNAWRVYLFIERARTYDILETSVQAFEAARAFGAFQKLLSDIPGERLYEIIPDFHNTVSRVEAFDKALAADAAGRAEKCREEIEFLQTHRGMASRLLDMQARGELPERITHNDTKLNNVMLDDETNEGICVIDLDTIMPGLSLYDFGDLVRTSSSPSAEDEKDLSKVYARIEMFEALAKGFIQGADGCLTPNEIRMMPFSGILITFEIGVRFLTDYLEGDKYFKVKRDDHNLDRCRTQFKLVQSLMDNLDKMDEIMKGLQ